jgi:phage tail-like protein
MADTLLTAFRFEVKLLRSASVIAGRQQLAGGGQGYTPPRGAAELGNGGFQDCSGLEIEMDVQEYVEGGRNNGTVRRVGRGRYQPVVLKRGMFFGAGSANTDLWHWMQRILNGERPVPRYDGIVHVMGADGTLRATWMFDRGLPTKIRGPELNAKTGEVAIEELTIAHEGLRLLPAEAPL